jgi:hypothetical protein
MGIELNRLKRIRDTFIGNYLHEKEILYKSEPFTLNPGFWFYSIHT